MGVTRAQPPQNPPPVQRVRVRYCKRGRARFLSHRDVARALERALRRAEIPMAYSSGFSPHPRISYAGACATGAATEADFFELGLARECEPAWVASALSDALPDGLDVVAVLASPWERSDPVSARSLTDQLTASRWRIELRSVEDALIDSAVRRLLASPEVLVTREVREGSRTFDVRGAIERLIAVPGGVEAIMQHTAPLVRPDDVVAALCALEPGLGRPSAALATRLEQGIWDGSRVVDPFDS